jgi:hypothetical protein
VKNVGFRETLSQLVSSRTETTEHHSNPSLQTHYYKTTKDKAIAAVERVMQQSGFTVKRVEQERGEVIAQSTSGQKSLLVATIVMVKPFRTAVDFSCSTDTILPSDFGHSKKRILSLYEQLDKELPYIGSGLGDELL